MQKIDVDKTYPELIGNSAPIPNCIPAVCCRCRFNIKVLRGLSNAREGDERRNDHHQQYRTRGRHCVRLCQQQFCSGRDLPGLINEVYNALTRVGRAGSVAPARRPSPPCRSRSPSRRFHHLSRGRQEVQIPEAPSAHAVRSVAGRISREWGLPPDYPMVAPNYAQARSNLAKQMGLGQQRRRRSKRPPNRRLDNSLLSAGPRKRARRFVARAACRCDCCKNTTAQPKTAKIHARACALASRQACETSCQRRQGGASSPARRRPYKPNEEE